MQKISKVASLAVSAEWLGNEYEAIAAGRRCGVLAKQYGVSLDDVWQMDPGFNRVGDRAMALAWSAVVDGYYEA